jgi:hypothetical protein
MRIECKKRFVILHGEGRNPNVMGGNEQTALGQVFVDECVNIGCLEVGVQNLNTRLGQKLLEL